MVPGCTSNSPADPQPIGIVANVKGFPSVTRSGRTYLLANQSRIFKGDIIQTDRDSMVDVNMIDETRIVLGKESRLVVHEYDYDQGDFFPVAKLFFTAGTIRVRTENIPRSWFGTFEIRTPLAAVLADRADFWGSMAAANRLDVGMLEGKHIEVINEHGSVKVKRNGLTTTILAGSAPSGAQHWSDRRLKAILEQIGR
ncbi:MAG: FecR domain-containing protein [Pseudomonadales bacterium]|nr:FecR domain-containing protein [Pseudomonadales bacterium]